MFTSSSWSESHKGIFVECAVIPDSEEKLREIHFPRSVSIHYREHPLAKFRALELKESRETLDIDLPGTVKVYGETPSPACSALSLRCRAARRAEPKIRIISRHSPCRAGPWTLAEPPAELQRTEEEKDGRCAQPRSNRTPARLYRSSRRHRVEASWQDGRTGTSRKCGTLVYYSSEDRNTVLSPSL